MAVQTFLELYQDELNVLLGDDQVGTFTTALRKKAVNDVYRSLNADLQVAANDADVTDLVADGDLPWAGAYPKWAYVIAAGAAVKLAYILDDAELMAMLEKRWVEERAKFAQHMAHQTVNAVRASFLDVYWNRLRPLLASMIPLPPRATLKRWTVEAYEWVNRETRAASSIVLPVADGDKFWTSTFDPWVNVLALRAAMIAQEWAGVQIEPGTKTRLDEELKRFKLELSATTDSTAVPGTFADLYQNQLNGLTPGLDPQLSLEAAKRFTNEGYAFVNRELRPTQTLSPVAVAANNAVVALPGTFAAFANDPILWVTTGEARGVTLTRKSRQELEDLEPGWNLAGYQAGTPKYYVFDEYNSSQFQLVPAPVAAGQVIFGIHPLMPAMAATSDQPWGGKYPEFTNLVALAAAVFALRTQSKLEREESAMIARRDDEMTRFRHFLAHRATPDDVVLPSPRRLYRGR